MPTAESPSPDPSAATTTQGQAPPTADEAKTAVLRVRVVVRETPLAGATVRVRRPETPSALSVAKTGSDGVARFIGVVRSEVVVEAFAEGYRVQTREDDGDGDSTDLVMRLEPGVAFDGRVEDAATAAPVAGASVSVHDWGEAFEFGPTDAEGRFHVPGVRNDDESALTASAAGYATARLGIRVDSGKVQPAEPVVRLERGGALVGVVRTGDGKPVPGATVVVAFQDEGPTEVPEEGAEPEPYGESIEHLECDDWLFEREGGAEAARATAGPDGSFRVEGLRLDTTYEATARAAGHAGASAVRGLRAGRVGVTLSLRRSAVVLLRVSVPAGLLLPSDARVRVFQHGLPVKPDGRAADGRFRFGALDPGPAIAFVQADGFRSAKEKIRLAEGERAEVEIALEAGATVEGVVVDAEGHPLANAEVQVASAGQNEAVRGLYLSHARKAETDAQGRFSVGGIAGGPAVLVAEWGDWEAERWLATRECVHLTAPARGVRVVLTPLGGVRMRLLLPDRRLYEGEVWTSTDDADGNSSGGSDKVSGGRLEQARLEDGDWVLRVAPEGYAWIRRAFTIRDGAWIDLGDVVLDPGVVISGRVVDSGGRPVAGADISCDENDDRSTITDAEGRFSLDRFPRERVTLQVTAEGFVPEILAMEPSRTTGLEVRLLRMATVRGSVRTTGGASAASIGLSFRPPEARLVRRTGQRLDGTQVEFDLYEGAEWVESDAAGRFESALAPGRWIGLWTDDAGKEHRVGEWELHDGETLDVEITLPGK